MAWTRDDLAGDPHRSRDKAERVQRMFGAIAPSYDLNNRLHAFGRDQAWRRRVVKLLKVGSGDRVLDVACGTGDLSEAAALAGADAVLGIDFTPEMLEIARVKAARLKCNAPEYRQGDATALELPDGAFDVAMIAFGIRNVSDPAAAVGEFARVLVPGGRLGILEFSEPRNPVLRWFNSFYTRRIMPLTATLIARDRSGAYRYLPRSIQTFLSPEELSSLLGKHGFEIERQVPLTFGTCTATIARRCD
ncbi:MAG: bifunctional demethylmenaquinone methyltransferase/2-methoxy-6-polyprenyl-1,4-benzoquinol methylase UbiE [Phycisphaerales bacterium]|nr:bifunctional demethylmenaquinone methyltransferase/2-methoxy-6-polyprenyl-1,4-benzoquinol methylase UbiE [Phycisphaerales bacterium]